MPTYRLTIEYDGTKFAGWQVQASGRTVQGVLLEALREATGEREIDLQGAGRTDAGVHALGQVGSLRCRGRLEPARLLRDLDRLLPAEVAVLEARLAPAGFHARHDATGRSYRYQLAERRSAFGKRFTWWAGERLDEAAMGRAAAHFAGRHDFAAFCKRAAATESTLVEVESCSVTRVGELILLRLVASHFLWNQVRRMVGALVAVGRGEAAPADTSRWLTGAAPPPALAAPAAGLFLEAVRYPGEAWALPPLLPVGVPLPRERWGG
ncbi:MAG: tRNA pseudouridine(38-40) synthase TruA [Acidobacteriota bacterium]